ncbi:hypothetical protein D3C87_1645800 [compost metagenome]
MPRVQRQDQTRFVFLDVLHQTFVFGFTAGRRSRMVAWSFYFRRPIFSWQIAIQVNAIAVTTSFIDYAFKIELGHDRQVQLEGEGLHKALKELLRCNDAFDFVSVNAAQD